MYKLYIKQNKGWIVETYMFLMEAVSKARALQVEWRLVNDSNNYLIDYKS